MANLRRLFVLQVSVAGFSTIALLLALFYLDPYHSTAVIRLLVYVVLSFVVTAWLWLFLTWWNKRSKMLVRPKDVALSLRHSLLVGLLVLVLVLLQSSGNFYWWSALSATLVVGGVEWLFHLS